VKEVEEKYNYYIKASLVLYIYEKYINYNFFCNNSLLAVGGVRLYAQTDRSTQRIFERSSK